MKYIATLAIVFSLLMWCGAQYKVTKHGKANTVVEMPVAM